uniref:RxLR effector candidate protein n=1 Tax=Hyaloperonospora arabidopsidis (strain Emoy2) TaxID=559515 RepID=M4B5A7_HYAAE
MVIFTSIINLYDNILINKYRGLITCNRLTPLHLIVCIRPTPQHYTIRLLICPMYYVSTSPSRTICISLHRHN